MTLPGPGAANVGQIMCYCEISSQFRFPDVNELEISDEYRQFEINLESFMNQTPFVATAEMDAAQVFSMFRGLGLRHLPILDQTDGKLSLVSIASC